MARTVQTLDKRTVNVPLTPIMRTRIRDAMRALLTPEPVAPVEPVAPADDADIAAFREYSATLREFAAASVAYPRELEAWKDGNVAALSILRVLDVAESSSIAKANAAAAKRALSAGKTAAAKTANNAAKRAKRRAARTAK